MKNIFKSALLLGFAVVALSACDADRESNPTLQTPETFKLNTPSYSGVLMDLANSTGLTFTWSQPDYGMPLQCEYALQFSPSGNFTVSTDEALADESGATVADYYTPATVYSVPEATIDVAELAKGLQRIEQWPQGEVPESQTLYVRASSTVADATIYSNTVQILVSPYYVELTNAAPQIWYLVGGIIGDGSWSNSTDAIGTGLLPMFTKAGASYDPLTGAGEIEWAGYLPVGEFKIVKTPGDWNYGFCGGSTSDPSAITYRNNDDDKGNIAVSEAGVYRITINTADITIAIEKLDGTTAYSSLMASGDFNSWGDDALTPMTTYDGAVECHNWKYEVTGATTIKFKLDGSWDTNWGAEDFPYGVGTTNGANIPVEEGSWVVYFNDITGAYYFNAK